MAPTTNGVREVVVGAGRVVDAVAAVGDGFVASLARPGGNVTGFTNTTSSLGGKWLELLREAVPGLKRVGYMFNRAVSPGGGAYYREPFEAAAKALD
jgi:putative ABC transport system substrate-binding protein